MNINLLLQVRERILAYPENYNQSVFCGTRCCIGGHIVAIADPTFSMENQGPGGSSRILNRAIKLLGISEDQSKLFAFAHDWPEEFADRYAVAKRMSDSYGMAQACADAIIDFIITDGWTQEADPSKLENVNCEQPVLVLR